jgi:hypothetical protein
VAAEPFEDGDIEVTLRLPPPLDVDFTNERDGDKAILRHGDQVIAEAVKTTLSLEPEPPVTVEQAERASKTFPWRETHIYPTCFVCGPKRTAGDGLCIYPGAVEGRKVAAAPWFPDASLDAGDGRVTRAVAWASLDCPSWFGYHCFDPSFYEKVLLGRLTARIVGRPRIGQPHVAIGWSLGRDGRKIHTASAVYTAAGALQGLARATWIVLK